VTDLDEGIDQGTGIENIDKLSFEWSSNHDGSLGTEASIDVGAGKASTEGIKLTDGKTHTITLRVTDDDGGFTEHTFTVKVGGKPKEKVIPSMGFVTFMVSLVAVASILALLERKSR
jgi:VCBS repeat-containing protein